MAATKIALADSSKVNPPPAVKTRRPVFAPTLFAKAKLMAEGFRQSNMKRLTDNGKAQAAHEMPRTDRGRGSSGKVSKLVKRPRLGPLKVRKKLLDQLCAKRGVSTPMGLAAQKLQAEQRTKRRKVKKLLAERKRLAA